jgi:RNA polymerase sigma factor (TIGR02999 family)
MGSLRGIVGLRYTPLVAAPPGEITVLLTRLRAGDPKALSELAPLVGAELRRLATGYLRQQPPGHTWQPSDLVNELWLRLLGRGELGFQNRTHFLGAAAHLMRAMVIDHARARSTAKRTPQALPEGTAGEFAELLALTDERAVELIALDGALTGLGDLNPRQEQIVEMRYFAGLTVEEVAAALEISPATVKREWDKARAWLHARIRGMEL